MPGGTPGPSAENHSSFYRLKAGFHSRLEKEDRRQGVTNASVTALQRYIGALQAWQGAWAYAAFWRGLLPRGYYSRPNTLIRLGDAMFPNEKAKKKPTHQEPPKGGCGDNRGPWVRSYLDWDGKDARWCAGFVCFALEQAAHTLGVNLPIDSSSSCDVLAMEAKTAGKFVPESKVKSGAFAKKDLVPSQPRSRSTPPRETLTAAAARTDSKRRSGREITGAKTSSSGSTGPPAEHRNSLPTSPTAWLLKCRWRPRSILR